MRTHQLPPVRLGRRKQKITAALGGLALTGGLLLPAVPVQAAPPAPVTVAGKAVPAGAYRTQEAKVLQVDFQYQETGYWCGPAATRIALSARMSPPSQAALAGQLNTDEDGTDWIGQVTGVLNNNLGTGWYETKEMPNDPPTQAQRDLLWNDIVLDIDNNYPIVANIVAPANNHPPGYPNYTIYHYFTVIGYDAADRTVLIADPAGFAPTATYWLTFDQLATLIPPKGYSA
ncbi:peptidase C39-like protein [Kribbella amoyensis]|uniref:Peptidase C39-like protein n=1 Tax=Kribbella amoyensis TaxID=996641 RepID=A0A561B0V4_9ACTN|nr:C39 family peptidase [Kribbella amoyensis]TWD72490.1 peptidase C39-like protein [Kribbella amoyensis]